MTSPTPTPSPGDTEPDHSPNGPEHRAPEIEPAWVTFVRTCVLPYAKAHIAVVGVVAGVLLHHFAATEFVKTYGDLVIALLTAAGVYGVPNTASGAERPAEAATDATSGDVPPTLGDTV